MLPNRNLGMSEIKRIGMTTDKTPATLAVDVLAVMARDAADAEQLRRNGKFHGNLADSLNQSEEARAAVAGLIEAAGKLRADVFLWRLTGNMPNLQMLANDEEALDAAISRVKGGTL